MVRVSAPGRVNLIGEHTDYAGLPVLPIAIQRRLTVNADRMDGAGVEAVSGRFDGVFRSDRDDNPEWSQHLGPALAQAGPVTGVRLAIGGDLPATGGLSSSSALTVAVILAVLRLDGRDEDDVIERAVAAERAGPIQGGAMDQTVIVHAVTGTALRIDFRPPAWRPVPVPDHIAFVAGYSGTPAPKTGAAADAYNARVAGTRIAAELLGGSLLAEVDATPQDLDQALPEMAEGLPVRAWARHVLTEAARVGEATAALSAGDLETLGRLFDASHASLATDYGVSTPRLDGLVAAARDAGAAGARLTGAGFGGWGVAVCSVDRISDVVGAMQSVGGEAFRAVPSGGAA